MGAKRLLLLCDRLLYMLAWETKAMCDGRPYTSINRGIWAPFLVTGWLCPLYKSCQSEVSRSNLGLSSLPCGLAPQTFKPSVQPGALRFTCEVGTLRFLWPSGPLPSSSPPYKASAVFRHSLKASARWRQVTRTRSVGSRNTPNLCCKTSAFGRVQPFSCTFFFYRIFYPRYLAADNGSVTTACRYLSIYFMVCLLPWQYSRLSSSSPGLFQEGSQSQ